MSDDDRLRTYMVAAERQSNPSSKRHLREEDLIDYLQDRLKDSQREEAQAHLVSCDACLALFRDVRDFFETRREAAEQDFSQAEVRREWKVFWRGVRAQAEVTRRTPLVTPFGLPLGPKAVYAMAAVLLLAVAFSVVAALRLRQKNTQFAIQLKERSAGEERIKQLEADNRKLQSS